MFSRRTSARCSCVSVRISYVVTAAGTITSGSAAITGRNKPRIVSKTAIRLSDQHTVAITVKAVFCGDCMTVCVHYKFVAAESGSKNEQRALRQVKVGEQYIDRAKLVARRDGQI